MFFEKLHILRKKLGIDIEKPRTISRQTCREKHPSDDVETYYRVVSIYILALNLIIKNFIERFSEDAMKLYSISILFSDMKEKDDTQFDEIVTVIVEKYSSKLEIEKKKMF